MQTIFLPVILISIFVTLGFTPVTIRYLRSIGLTVKDVHKKNEPNVPHSGGIAVLLGALAGLFSFIFLRVFVYGISTDIVYIFAGVTTLTLITFIGFFDDLRIKANTDGLGGLKQWQKPLLTLPAAVPLMVVAAGTTIIGIPLLGKINFGILYPLVLVPIIVVGAANMVNMFEGLNGLGSGMGMIYMASLGLFAYVNGEYIATAIAFSMLGSLFAFWWFHKVPAKILAGDSLTYLLGASIACVAILGNIEKAALIISIPFFIEFFFKLRGRLKKKTIGYLTEDGKIKSKYDKIYSLAHIWMKGKHTEKQVVRRLMLFELVFAILIWLI